MADAFGNMVYEQSDSLKPAADKFHLTVQSADNVTRQPNPALGASNPLNNDKLLKALFNDDAIKNKRNTEAVQVGPNTLVSARIVDYRGLGAQVRRRRPRCARTTSRSRPPSWPARTARPARRTA